MQDTGRLVRVYRDATGTLQTLSQSKIELLSHAYGRVGKRPVVACMDVQDAIEVGMWTYGQGAIPLVIDPNNEAVMDASIAWYTPDSYIGDIELFSVHPGAQYEQVAFLSRRLFEGQEIERHQSAFFTLWNEAGQELAYLCPERTSARAYHPLHVEALERSPFMTHAVSHTCACGLPALELIQR